MSTARTIIKNRVKAGNTVIGVGCYSAAIETRSDDKVLKVGNTTCDPWLQFYERVIKVNPTNPHLPKVHSIHVDHQNDYYVAVVEKLYEHYERWMGDRCGEDMLEETVRRCCSDASFNREKMNYELEACETCYGEYDSVQLYTACRQIRDLVSMSYQDADCDCEYYLEEDEECPHSGYERLSVDLHTNNILYRKDGTLVINDPVCDADMEDVDDLSIWADDMEIVE